MLAPAVSPGCSTNNLILASIFWLYDSCSSAICSIGLVVASSVVPNASLIASLSPFVDVRKSCMLCCINSPVGFPSLSTSFVWMTYSPPSPMTAILATICLVSSSTLNPAKEILESFLSKSAPARAIFSICSLEIPRSWASCLIFNLSDFAISNWPVFSLNLAKVLK